MPIQINQQQTRVDAPEIQLTGRRVIKLDKTGDVDPLGTELISVMEETNVGSTSHPAFAKREVAVYSGAVTMEIVPDTNFTATNYSRRVAEAGTEFIGAAGMNKNSVNQTSETYYTLNGKDPSRTKANLWTGQPITLRHNKSGTDNTVIKAKTYVNGLESPTMRVEIRIIRQHEKTL